MPNQPSSALRELWGLEDQFTALVGSATGTIRFNRKALRGHQKAQVSAGDSTAAPIHRVSSPKRFQTRSENFYTKANSRQTAALDWLSQQFSERTTVRSLKESTDPAEDRRGITRSFHAALRRLGKECRGKRAGRLFECLYSFPPAGGAERSVLARKRRTDRCLPSNVIYSRLSKELRISTASVRKMAEQMRRRFDVLLREERKNLLDQPIVIIRATVPATTEGSEREFPVETDAGPRMAKITRTKDGLIVRFAAIAREKAR
jgi:hypothetical protein